MSSAIIASVGVLALTSTAQGVEPPRPNNFRSDQAANTLAGVAANRFRAAVGDDPSFVELAIRDDGVVVETTGNPSAVVSAAAAAAPVAVPFAVRSVRNGIRALRSITDRLDADSSKLRDQGVLLSSWGPDFDTNKVLIVLEQYTPAIAQQLVDAYGGPDVVQVSTQADKSSASGRNDDTPAFFGGNNIVGGGYTCTSWFTTRSNVNGALYQFTAAHCGGGTWTLSNGNTFGTVSSSNWSGSVDAETFKNGGASYVWADPGATNRSVVSKTGTNNIGDLVCTDGHVDREVCNVEVINGDISISYDGHTVTHTIRARQKANQNAFTPGDSGGPVYALVSGGVQARGMILSHSSVNYEGNYGNLAQIQSAFQATVCPC